MSVSKLTNPESGEISEISVSDSARCSKSVNPDKGERSEILSVCVRPNHFSFVKPFKGERSVALQSYKRSLVRFVNPARGERSVISECTVSNFCRFLSPAKGARVVIRVAEAFITSSSCNPDRGERSATSVSSKTISHAVLSMMQETRGLIMDCNWIPNTVTKFVAN